MVERQPSKLRVAGSNPVSRSIPLKQFKPFRRFKQYKNGLSGLSGFKAHVAQSAEHILGKDEVTGSIPVMGSILKTNEYMQWPAAISNKRAGD